MADIELMYRQPGLPEHQNITDVLDEIIFTLRELEERMTIVEEFCDAVSAQTNDNYGGTD